MLPGFEHTCTCHVHQPDRAEQGFVFPEQRNRLLVHLRYHVRASQMARMAARLLHKFRSSVKNSSPGTPAECIRFAGFTAAMDVRYS